MHLEVRWVYTEHLTNMDKAITITALSKIITNVAVFYGNNVHRNSSATNIYQ